MHQGNWTCSSCGTTITELPFEPRSNEGLKCRYCHQKERAEKSGGGASSNQSGERKMYTGDWNCSSCGNSITELPFEPRSTENLRCRDCFMKEKAGG